jgi:transcriptional regulator with XRE-family HTH domain
MGNVRAREFLAYIGANVHRARTRAGMTQERLAEAAGMDLRFFQRIERGQTNVSVLFVVALAQALGVSPGSLFRKAAMPAPSRGRPPGRGKAAAKKRA